MKEATISELKAHLSAFLAAVRRGDSVIVKDRQTPIAHLGPLVRGDEELDELVIEEAPEPPRRLPKRGSVKLLRPIEVVALLRADRDAR